MAHDPVPLIGTVGALLPAIPGAATALLLVVLLLGHRPSERWTWIVVRGAILTTAVAWLAVLGLLLRGGGGALVPSLGAWFRVGHEAFEIHLALDAPALVYGGLSLGLIGLVAAFSRRYLHREPGFHRFYALLLVFLTGLQIVSFAGSLDVLLIGWELVGLASTLLIAFFNRRPKPVRNALRAFVTYRVCDVGLVLAILLLHHGWGGASLSSATNGWLALPVDGTAPVALVGLCLLLAAAGKSAQVPFSGWLPRAMEGPTPSSAVFYGALSVHLGPFLLLRARDLIAAEPVVAGAVVLLGGATALHGALAGAVQTDVKSRLAYGSITQVGLIVAEIGLGLHVLALVHTVGHAGYRTLQILRAPSLLHDRTHLEQNLGHGISHDPDLARDRRIWLGRPVPYRIALERGGFDGLLKDVLLGIPLEFLRRFDRAEEAFTGALARRLIGRLPGNRARTPSAQEDVRVP